MHTESVAFLAGNPRVTKLPNGTIDIDPQLEAFDECLKIVAACREQIAGIYIAFDHIGRFDNNFLDTTNLSRRKAMHPRMSNLIPELRAHYEPVAARYGISLGDIHIITEGWCRLNMIEEAKTSNLRGHFTTIGKPECEKGMCTTGDKSPHSNHGNSPDEERLRINCRGITAAIFKRLAERATRVEAVWKYDPLRCKPDTLTAGAILAKRLWNTASVATITNHFIFPRSDGRRKIISKITS